MRLDAGSGVTLQGCYSSQPAGQAKGTVLLLHGWLGSVHSGYVLALGNALYRRGHAVFRLNLRDHGDTHRLNPGVFRSDRLAEVFEAARQVAGLAGGGPLHVVGASLGGNFALRLVWQHSQTPLFNLGHTLAVCPVIDPNQTTLNIDHGPWVYLAYFRRKWRRALAKKQAAFPERYNFAQALAAPTCLGMTEAFVRRYSPYPDAQTYFAHYAVTPAMVAALRTPTVILAAVDDPVISVADFAPLVGLNPLARVHIQPYGGHVGFVDVFPWRRWLAGYVAGVLENPPQV
jgi:predicted alpha/beta-fold hydrolase